MDPVSPSELYEVEFQIWARLVEVTQEADERSAKSWLFPGNSSKSSAHLATTGRSLKCYWKTKLLHLIKPEELSDADLRRLGTWYDHLSSGTVGGWRKCQKLLKL